MVGTTVTKYGKAKIADGVKHLNRLLDIINQQASLFENVYLLLRSNGLMRVSDSHKIKMSRWVRCSYGKRAGFVGTKLIYYF